MPFTKMEEFAQTEGFCCPWAMLHSRRKWKTSVMVEDSITNGCALTARAIRYWRRAERRNEVKCAECKGCLQAKVKAEQPGRTLRKTP